MRQQVNIDCERYQGTSKTSSKEEKTGNHFGKNCQTTDTSKYMVKINTSIKNIIMSFSIIQDYK